MSRLALRGLTKAYGTLNVVDGVDLELQEGEFVSLLGPSGCGKTTTLRMIAGFVAPTAGTIEMEGQVLSSAASVLPPERRQMSMIFQSYAIWPNMTVAENVGFGLKLRRLSGEEIKRRTAEMLDVVQLGHLAGRYPAELSGGQQQRVALARAIVVKPSVLLLDEPLSNLDANLREEMRFEIRRLHDEFHITTVYVTHDQSEAMATSDRIAVMNAGKIEQVAPPHLLYTRPRTRFVAGFIGRTNLLEARLGGGEIGFGGFAMKTEGIDLAAANGRATGLFSVRPRGIALHEHAPASTAGLMAATITGRTYLGDSWDYSVTGADGSLALRVAASPLQVLEVGALVWLEFDPRQMALVE